MDKTNRVFIELIGKISTKQIKTISSYFMGTMKGIHKESIEKI